jgi:hypothetical protein
MEIIVNTNVLIRKLMRVYNLSSPIEPTLRMLKYADFFGPDFYKASLVLRMLYGPRQQDVHTDVLVSLLDRNVSKDTKGDERANELRSLLEGINLQSMKIDAELSESAKNGLPRDYANIEAKASEWIKKIFGFELPERLDVIFDINPRSGQGLFISDSPPLIALSYPEYGISNVGVLLHEMMHFLISKNGMKARLRNADPMLEETLNDYFCPGGILDEKVGLLDKKMNLEAHQKEQVMFRPASRQLSDRLMPLMKEYLLICGDETIWKFLEKKGILANPGN